jgi:hypothetical protein
MKQHYVDVSREERQLLVRLPDSQAASGHGDYETVAASQTAQTLSSSAGAGPPPPPPPSNPMGMLLLFSEES